MNTNLILLSFLLAVINCFAGKTPNIILILADDMGQGELSHMGGLVPSTMERMGSTSTGCTIWKRILVRRKI